MTVIYSQNAINDRLLGVVTAIGEGGSPGVLYLMNNSGAVLSTMQLAQPCGTVNGGVLTFTGQLLDPSAIGGGYATFGKITDSNGNIQISGLTVGIPLSGYDIQLTNGLNSTYIGAGQVVELLGAQITGS